MDNIANKIAFYAQTEDGYDQLILDLFERDYKYDRGLDRRELWDRSAGRGRGIEITCAQFNKLLDAVENSFNMGEFDFSDGSYEERQAEKKYLKRKAAEREFVPKERVWKAIRLEVDEDETDDLTDYDKYRLETDDYFDLALVISNAHKFMAGEISVGRYRSWLALMTRCTGEVMSDLSGPQAKVYEYISDCFDGHAFIDSDISEARKRYECLELIALLKHLDYELSAISSDSDAPFATNGVSTYVAFYAYMGENELTKVCVADDVTHRVNIMFVRDIVLREDINYTFMSQAEFDRLPCRYRDYSFDPSLPSDYAAHPLR